MAPIDRTLLDRYMQGACSPEEEALVHRWLDEEDLEDYPEVWEEPRYARHGQRALRRLARSTTELHVASAGGARPWTRLGRVAAAAALVGGLTLAAYFSFLYSGFRKVYQTAFGEIRSISLEDGTTVTLNACSVLKIDKDFNRQAREVYLQGEGYFKIGQQAGKPFVVHADKLSVTALGTAFDVTAFPDEPEIAVSLREGSVLVEPLAATHERRRVVLTPGEEVVFSRKTTAMEVKSYNAKERVSWQRQIIYFENADIREVLNKLSRFYGVTFDTERLKPRKWRLTGEYRNETLRDVLESLCFNYNLKYMMEGQHVILYEQ